MATAQARLDTTSSVKPDFDSAKPPFRPRAISRYKDRKREMAAGNSRFERSNPAVMPNTKKRIAGSRKFCMVRAS